MPDNSHGSEGAPPSSPGEEKPTGFAGHLILPSAKTSPTSRVVVTLASLAKTPPPVDLAEQPGAPVPTAPPRRAEGAPPPLPILSGKEGPAVSQKRVTIPKAPTRPPLTSRNTIRLPRKSGTLPKLPSVPGVPNPTLGTKTEEFPPISTGSPAPATGRKVVPPPLPAKSGHASPLTATGQGLKPGVMSQLKPLAPVGSADESIFQEAEAKPPTPTMPPGWKHLEAGELPSTEGAVSLEAFSRSEGAPGAKVPGAVPPPLPATPGKSGPLPPPRVSFPALPSVGKKETTPSLPTPASPAPVLMASSIAPTPNPVSGAVPPLAEKAAPATTEKFHLPPPLHEPRTDTFQALPLPKAPALAEPATSAHGSAAIRVGPPIGESRPAPKPGAAPPPLPRQPSSSAAASASSVPPGKVAAAVEPVERLSSAPLPSISDAPVASAGVVPPSLPGKEAGKVSVSEAQGAEPVSKVAPVEAHAMVPESKRVPAESKTTTPPAKSLAKESKFSPAASKTAGSGAKSAVSGTPAQVAETTVLPLIIPGQIPAKTPRLQKSEALRGSSEPPPPGGRKSGGSGGSEPPPSRPVTKDPSLPPAAAPTPAAARALRARRRRIVSTVSFYLIFAVVLAVLYLVGLRYSRETRVEGQIIPPQGMPLGNEVWIVNDFREDALGLTDDLAKDRAPKMQEIQEQLDHVHRAQADIAAREERIRLLKDQQQAAKDQIETLVKQAHDAAQQIWDGPVAALENEYTATLNQLQARIADHARSLNLKYVNDDTYHSPEVWANAFRLALYQTPPGVDGVKEHAWIEDQIKTWRAFTKSYDDRKEKFRLQAAQLQLAPTAKVGELNDQIDDLQHRIESTMSEEDPIKAELQQAQADLAQSQAEEAGLDGKYYQQLDALPESSILTRLPLAPNGRFSWRHVEKDHPFNATEKVQHYWFFVRATRADGRQYWALHHFNIGENQTAELIVEPTAFISTKAILRPDLGPDDQK